MGFKLFKLSAKYHMKKSIFLLPGVYKVYKVQKITPLLQEVVFVN